MRLCGERNVSEQRKSRSYYSETETFWRGRGTSQNSKSESKFKKSGIRGNSLNLFRHKKKKFTQNLVRCCCVLFKYIVVISENFN